MEVGGCSICVVSVVHAHVFVCGVYVHGISFALFAQRVSYAKMSARLFCRLLYGRLCSVNLIL